MHGILLLIIAVVGFLYAYEVPTSRGSDAIRVDPRSGRRRIGSR